MDTQQLIQDTATKIFSDHCDKALLDRSESGEFASELWQQITANGFHQLGDAASGTTAADTYAFLKVCGRFAVPLPMSEIILGHSWGIGSLAPCAGLISIGRAHGDTAIQVPWGRRAACSVASRRIRTARAGTRNARRRPCFVHHRKSK